MTVARHLDRRDGATYLTAMFVMTPDTVWNPGALETRRIPKKILGRVALLPRRGVDARLLARVAVEGQFLRFTAALAPFILAMLVWPEAALPISQAPLAMLVVIGVVEMKLLRIAPERRADVTSAEAAARTLDALRFRAARLLARIAARRGMADGRLHLVVEQSELARIAPLTLVSVQFDGDRREVVALDADEVAMLRDDLFDDELTETALHRANLRDNTFLRDMPFDVAGVSAHARLAARLRAVPVASADLAAMGPAS